MPLGVENHLIRWGVAPERITALAWWEELQLDGLTLGCTPARHYSSRKGIDAGSIEITSGQVPIDPATSAAVEGAIAKQPRQSLTNVQAVLAAAGLTMDNVIKNTVFLKNMNDFAAMKEVYATFFTGNPPARSGSSAHKSNGQNSLKKRLNSGLSSSLPVPQSRTNRFTGGNTAESFVLCKGCGFPAKEMRKAVAGICR